MEIGAIIRKERTREVAIRILLIEDNPDHAVLTERILKEAVGYEVDFARDAKEGLAKITEGNYQVILCDYRLSDSSALDILGEMREKGKDLPFIVVTAAGSEKIAVELMKQGAYDYIVKDASYEDTLPIVIKNALEVHNAKKEKERLVNEIKDLARFPYEDPSPVMRIASNGMLLYANPASSFLLQDWGCQAGQLVPQRWRDVIMETFSGGMRKNIEIEHKNSFFSVVMAPVAEGNYVNLYALDITERKKAEKKLEDAYLELKHAQEQLIQSAKMVAMGQLAAGISHELNQPLTGVKGFAQAALMDLDKDSLVGKDLRKIVEQADRMDKIIQSVGFFSRKSEFKMEDIDINGPVEDSINLLQQQLRVHNIRVTKLLAERLPKIKGDANQLQQAFLNLITNARDAINSLNNPEGGELAIKTSLQEDKRHIEVVFQDTGCGIPKENIGHIFNPFFTTKSPGGGVGLGLAIVYRIVESHFGRIEVDSQEGKGTNFKIIFPVL